MLRCPPASRPGVGRTFSMDIDVPNVIVGGDMNSDTHCIAIIDERRQHLFDEEFLAIGSGCRKILSFITHFGLVIGVGVEGTASHGAELSRALRSAVLLVERRLRGDLHRRDRGEEPGRAGRQPAQLRGHRRAPGRRVGRHRR